MANPRMPSPFRFRGKWRAQVTLENGLRPARTFLTHGEAKDWIASQLANANNGHAPRLGGPTAATLADALAYYATVYTVNKRGAKAELNRINHYLEGAGQPCLQVGTDPNGARAVVARGERRATKAFDAHNDARRKARTATYQRIAALAKRPCSRIATVDIRELMADMSREGLEDSTIQKEVALLKHLFNVAANEWNWVGFANPCHGIKLGKSNQRFVFLSDDQRRALWTAIGECDNPLVGPLVAIACETTLRTDSLITMKWSDVDLDGRLAHVQTKTGPATIPLSLDAVVVFKSLPRTSERVFPMSANAVDMAWDGVRRKAGVPTLQFRDLRHVGATDYARRGLSAPQLARVLGHKSLAMAQVYINLVASDITEALDRTRPAHTVYTIAPLQAASPQALMRERRSERLAKALATRMAEEAATTVVGNPEEPSSSVAAPVAAPDSEPEQVPAASIDADNEVSPGTGAVIYRPTFGTRRTG